MDSHLLPNPRRLPLTIHSGDGCYVFDGDGRRYLDLVSGIGVNALGYNHPRITAAITEQSRRAIHTSGLYAHPYAEPLAAALCRISGLDRVLFTNSGAEANEAALKLARSHQPCRSRLVALQGSFHGRTRGSLAITGQEGLRQSFAPYSAEVTFVGANDEAALRDAVTSETAAVILEPVQGEGGIHPLTDSFLRLARDLTQSHGALLITDEAQCGLGRTGRHFAHQWSGIRPDIVTVAKPLAGGLPMGAVLFTEAVNATFPPAAHGSTFAGGPLACRVALEFLAVLDELLPHIREIGAELRAGLDRLRARHPKIRDVRSRGMMFGIQLDQLADPFVEAALARGLLVNCTQGTTLRLLPSYILTHAQAADALGILDAVLL